MASLAIFLNMLVLETSSTGYSATEFISPRWTTRAVGWGSDSWTSAIIPAAQSICLSIPGMFVSSRSDLENRI